MDATVVRIDQTEKSVQAELRAAWFPRGTRPSVELSGRRDWPCLVGAITEGDDRVFARDEESGTAVRARHINLTFYTGLEEDVLWPYTGRRTFERRPSRVSRPVTTAPSSWYQRISPHWTLLTSADGSFRPRFAIDCSTRLTGYHR